MRFEKALLDFEKKIIGTYSEVHNSASKVQENKSPTDTRLNKSSIASNTFSI
jgi:hypothetical protein